MGENQSQQSKKKRAHQTTARPDDVCKENKPLQGRDGLSLRAACATASLRAFDVVAKVIQQQVNLMQTEAKRPSKNAKANSGRGADGK